MCRGYTVSTPVLCRSSVHCPKIAVSISSHHSTGNSELPVLPWLSVTSQSQASDRALRPDSCQLIGHPDHKALCQGMSAGVRASYQGRVYIPPQR